VKFYLSLSKFSFCFILNKNTNWRFIIMLAHQQMFKEILELPPIEKIDLVEKILESLDRDDQEIDKLWSQEAENRLNAYHAGQMKSIPLEQIVSKYKHNGH